MAMIRFVGVFFKKFFQISYELNLNARELSAESMGDDE